MSDVANEIKKIGPSPLKSALRTLLWVAGAVCIGILILALKIEPLMILAAILVLGGGFIGFIVLVLILVALGTTGLYRDACSAVRDGFKPSWVVRRDTLAGLLMVDEQAKKLFLNGRIYDYSEVSDARCWVEPRNHYIEVTLNHGDEPVQKVHVASEADARNAFARLSNALNAATA